MEKGPTNHYILKPFMTNYYVSLCPLYGGKLSLQMDHHIICILSGGLNHPWEFSGGDVHGSHMTPWRAFPIQDRQLWWNNLRVHTMILSSSLISMPMFCPVGWWPTCPERSWSELRDQWNWACFPAEKIKANENWAYRNEWCWDANCLDENP